LEFKFLKEESVQLAYAEWKDEVNSEKNFWKYPQETEDEELHEQMRLNHGYWNMYLHSVLAEMQQHFHNQKKIPINHQHPAVELSFENVCLLLSRPTSNASKTSSDPVTIKKNLPIPQFSDWSSTDSSSLILVSRVRKNAVLSDSEDD